MNSTVKKLEIAYNSINERNTFTNGDFVTGQVTVEMGKDCQIESLFVKFKAKAEVMWTERHGDHTVVYHSKDKYFTLKTYFIRNKNVKEKQHVQLTNQNATSYPSVLAPGVHVYPFCFQIPLQGIPSSFKGSDGKIVFSLEAELSRSMRINKKSSTTINFVAKLDPHTLPGLMTPVRNSKDKKMHVFTSGSVAMEVNLEKSGFFQGEGIMVVSSIQNNSSREIKPKYCLYRKHSFFAKGKRRVHTKDLVKEVGAPIPKKKSETVKQVITVPHDAEPSILNCNIIKAEYRLKVYLDIKYTSDPTIKLDIAILRASQGSTDVPPSYSAAGFGPQSFGNSAPAPWNPAPPAWNPAPPSGYPAPPSGYPAPPSGNPAPPAWNPAPPAWNPAPPSGYPAPPSGNPAPPAWNPAPPSGYPAPPSGYPAPPSGNPAPPSGNPTPPAWNPAPPSGYPAPPSGNPAPPSGNPTPPAWNPAPPSGNPAPPAWNPAPPQPSSVSPPLPPPYGTHQLYPSPNDFSQKKF